MRFPPTAADRESPRITRILTKHFRVPSCNSWLFASLLALLLLLPLTGKAQAHAPSQASDCTTASPGADPSPTVCVSEVIVTTNAVAPSNRFSVSWVSQTPETGSVKMVGIDSSFGDVRGPGFSGITHYVQVSNLQPSAAYLFDVISGGNTYTNGGQHWNVTVGPALNQPSPDNIIGRVKNADGSDATEALVYAKVVRVSDSAASSLVSMNPPMTQDDGGLLHSISLSDARTIASNLNYDGQFAYDPKRDKVVVTAVGPDGFASVTVNIGAAKPRAGGVNVILTLGSGFVSYNTPTATPIPPTLTATPITPTATQTEPPLTATALAATETATAFTSTPTFAAAPPTATIPRPTATRPPIIPTATVPIITIVPAGQTNAAQATLEAELEGTPQPVSTRFIYPLTEKPPGNSLLTGITSGASILAALAIVAFIGAAVLGGAAIFIWRRK